MDTIPMAELLAAHPFFAGLDSGPMAFIAGCAKNTHFGEGERIFREGELVNRFYAIRHGRVAMEIYSPVKGRIITDTADEGEIVGWSWLVSPYRAVSDARAVRPVSAVEIDGSCLRDKCEADPRLGYELLKRVTSVMYQRLAGTRVQLLDLYDGGERGVHA